MKKLVTVIGSIMMLAAAYTFLLSGCDKNKSVYDEKANGVKAFEKTLRQTKAPKQTLVVFGANWCRYCVMLDESMNEEPVKSFIKKHFNVVKIDVGEEGKNQTVKDFFGEPTRKGIPAIGIVNADKAIVYQSVEGTFSKANYISPSEMKQFLMQFAAI